jgi:hypothetical protein
MKTTIYSALAGVVLFQGAVMGNTYSLLATTNCVFENSPTAGFKVQSNLMVYGPPYGTNAPANLTQIVKTNGLECHLFILSKEPTRCFVTVFNYTTNCGIACLRMPAAYACRIALLDEQGHQVKKTAAGMKFGLSLSQEQIGSSFRHWKLPNQSAWLKLYPNGLPKYAGVPRSICDFDVGNAFKIEKPGDYDLHLQMRLVQSAQDKSGKLHFLITWLPEVVVKIHITRADIQ